MHWFSSLSVGFLFLFFFLISLQVLGSNPDAQHAEAVISPAKDAYYLSPCDVGQFLVLELCEEVAIEVIAIANREYFSSTFKVTDRT